VPRCSNGLAFVEAVISAGLLIMLVAGFGRLMVMSSVAGRAAADETTALFLAVQKIEQLRGLAWTYDWSATQVSDFTTRLAVDPPGSDGSGLRPSPSESLQRNVPGFVDFLDRDSRWLGMTSPPRGTSFIRPMVNRPTRCRERSPVGVAGGRHARLGLGTDQLNDINAAERPRGRVADCVEGTPLKL